MTTTHEVVVTGIGIVSPIGIGRNDFWDSVIAGSSGVSVTEIFESTGMPSKIGGEIRDFDPKQHVRPRKSLKVMCREIQTAFAAAAMAAEESGIAELDIDRGRIGSVFGSQMMYSDIPDLEQLYRASLDDGGQFSFDQFADSFPSKMNPLWMLKYLPNMPSCHVAIGLDAQGPNNSVVLGDASGLLAMIEGINCIRRGMADIMVCGGTGCRLNLTPRAYRGDLGVSRKRNDAPTAASRPFDSDRDGMVNGEGAGALILERADHAQARGAKIFCRIAGYGSSVDVGNDVQSMEHAILNSINLALVTESVDASQISHVNAHGLSTIEQDESEAKAIQSALSDVPVTALKSLFGYLGPGSGTIELAASIIGLENNVVPPTINYSDPDPKCPVNVVTSPLACAKPYVLALNQSGTGQTASLMIARP
ncbi:MAG: beta-ketoacyl-[acyl-carrier-protein] synthase family protein [Planctomycetales bacterium]|nr:beta-ketoacyl-[acyl-carrier-protein] synthase family protein [Planctomycetales bacterium]